MAKRGDWSARGSQVDAELDITQVLERPQAGETVQQIPDNRLEDSRYQARSSMDDERIAELEQAMEEAGFQGVLIARPHGNLLKREQGVLELVYGHRRRAAWRRVCAKRKVACVLPVIVRSLSDEQLLTIGAQENLQREDLDPIEESQIVAWHQKLYSEKNQAEIGQMLGKSVSWVKSRSRIAQLPEELKKQLRRRPRSVDQMLDIGKWYEQEPEAALQLGQRVVEEELSADQVRVIVRGYVRPEEQKKFGAEPNVKESTSADNRPEVTPKQVSDKQRTQDQQRSEVNEPTDNNVSRSEDTFGQVSVGIVQHDDIDIGQPMSPVASNSATILRILERWQILLASSPEQQQEISSAVRQIQEILDRLTVHDE